VLLLLLLLLPLLLLLSSHTTASMHFPAEVRALDFFFLEERDDIPVTGFSKPGRSDAPKYRQL